MTETIRQAIKRAAAVHVFIENDYHDFTASQRLKISKKQAREVVARAPKDRLPSAQWNGDELTLIPEAWKDHE